MDDSAILSPPSALLPTILSVPPSVQAPLLSSSMRRPQNDATAGTVTFEGGGEVGGEFLNRRSRADRRVTLSTTPGEETDLTLTQKGPRAFLPSPTTSPTPATAITLDSFLEVLPLPSSSFVASRRVGGERGEGGGNASSLWVSSSAWNPFGPSGGDQTTRTPPAAMLPVEGPPSSTSHVVRPTRMSMSAAARNPLQQWDGSRPTPRPRSSSSFVGLEGGGGSEEAKEEEEEALRTHGGSQREPPQQLLQSARLRSATIVSLSEDATVSRVFVQLDQSMSRWTTAASMSILAHPQQPLGSGLPPSSSSIHEAAAPNRKGNEESVVGGGGISSSELALWLLLRENAAQLRLALAKVTRLRQWQKVQQQQEQRNATITTSSSLSCFFTFHIRREDTTSASSSPAAVLEELFDAERELLECFVTLLGTHSCDNTNE